MDDIAIAVRDVAKRYQVFSSERGNLLHTLWPGYRAGMQEIWALQDISFEVRRGDSVAVIGRNGGGKSTLLQILAGTLTPTRGEVRVNGRVSALLELGSGFNPEYTGRDNVMLNGLLLGLSRQEILRRFDEIAAFADIGDAIERPVKTYSSGMMMRLAFAVQVLTDPQILVIDEALSVGDFFFQQKCFRHIRGLREKGVTLVFVSHDMASVRDLCTTGVYLKAGRIDYLGDNLEAIRRYLSHDESPAPAAESTHGESSAQSLAASTLDEPFWKRPAGEIPPGSKGAILGIGVADSAGNAVQQIRIGKELVFRVLFRSSCPEPLHVTIVIKNRYDQIVTATGSYMLKTPTPKLGPNQEAVFEIRMWPLIEAGDYSFSVSLAQPDAQGVSGQVIDETPSLGPLRITWDYASEIPPFYGMVGLQSSARFVVGQGT